MKIAIDAMGGDYAPLEIIKGASQARDELHIEPILVGDEGKLQDCIKELKISPPLQLVHAPDVITMVDSPTGIRTRRGASICVAAQLVKNSGAVGLVSAGSTGATTLAASAFIGRIHGIRSPSIATVLPATNGFTLLLDVGASLEHKGENILQSARMGRIFANRIFQKENPRIGLLNVGEEVLRGSPQVKESFRLLQDNCPGFVGNAEGHELFSEGFDVIVTDGFTGNVTLKVIEGTASMITGLFREELGKGIFSKVGALLMKKGFSIIKGKMDYSSYGGAPLLGVKGNVIISHGRSQALAIKNAIRIAGEMAKAEVVESIILDLQTKEGDGGDEKNHHNRDWCLCTREDPHQS